MSRNKRDQNSSSSFWTGLIGLGIGVVGGLLVKKLLNDSERKEENEVKQPVRI
jgi:hypothetical protein